MKQAVGRASRSLLEATYGVVFVQEEATRVLSEIEGASELSLEERNKLVEEVTGLLEEARSNCAEVKAAYTLASNARTTAEASKAADDAEYWAKEVERRQAEIGSINICDEIP